MNIENEAPPRSKYLLLLLILLLIPVFGLVTGISTKAYYDHQFQQGLSKALVASGKAFDQNNLPSLSAVCNNPQFSVDFADVCQNYTIYNYLILASIGTVIASFFLILFIKSTAIISRNNRTLLATIFKSVIIFVLICLSVLTIMQGVIAAFSFFTLETTYFAFFHPVIPIIIVAVSVLGALIILINGLALSAGLTSKVNGYSLDTNTNNEIVNFINDIATKLGSVVPKNIIVGLEPNFYVTAASIHTIGDNKIYRGESLYLSLPLMRVLSKPELTAIIGHELGHFKGSDTKYSLKFAPIYSGLSGAILALEERQKTESIGNISLLPAFVILCYLLSEFTSIERAISRLRELEADRVGASLTSHKVLSTALVKISIYCIFWEIIQKKNIENLNHGNAFQNMSVVYQNLCNSLNTPEIEAELLAKLPTISIAHPTDTHPPIATRLESLGISLDEIKSDIFEVTNDSSIQLINNPEAIEKQLTIIEEQLMLLLGYAKLPNPEKVKE